MLENSPGQLIPCAKMSSNLSYLFSIGLKNVGQGWDWLLIIPRTNICSENSGEEIRLLEGCSCAT